MCRAPEDPGMETIGPSLAESAHDLPVPLLPALPPAPAPPPPALPPVVTALPPAVPLEPPALAPPVATTCAGSGGNRPFLSSSVSRFASSKRVQAAAVHAFSRVRISVGAQR